jgi:hypothetical protein
MTVLKELARQTIRYGLKPEDIGPVSTFTDEEYTRCYIGHLRGFEARPLSVLPMFSGTVPGANGAS